jgi:hypothetical protein
METLALLESFLPEYVRTITYVPWVFSLLGSALIGLSGILPLIIIPSHTAGDKDKEIKNREYRVKFQVSSVIQKQSALSARWKFSLSFNNFCDSPLIKTAISRYVR